MKSKLKQVTNHLIRPFVYGKFKLLVYSTYTLFFFIKLIILLCKKVNKSKNKDVTCMNKDKIRAMLGKQLKMQFRTWLRLEPLDTCWPTYVH